MPERALVVIPTYNERVNLPLIVPQILQQDARFEVLVVDDNSPDGTGRLADEMAAAEPRIHVLHRPGKAGLGKAYIAGFKWALERGYDLIFEMDADFSHHPRYLPALLAGMRRYDVMIGSRYVKGGGTVNWPLSRRLISGCLSLLVRMLMRVPARDSSGAYRCYRVSKLRQAHLERVRSRGYSFQQEVLYRCRKAGCKIGETPIIFENRRAGASKVNPREAARSMMMILLTTFIANIGAGVSALGGNLETSLSWLLTLGTMLVNGGIFTS